MARTFGLFLAPAGTPAGLALLAILRRLPGTALGLLLGVVVLGVALRLAWAAPAAPADVAVPPTVLAPYSPAPYVAPTAAPVPPARSALEQQAAPPATAAAPYRTEAFSFQGRAYMGVTAAAGATFVATQAGTIQVRVYQLIDGEIRVGSNVSSLPFFPYVTLVTASERITYRPGALASTAELAVRDGQRVAAGDALFTLVSAEASSWRTLYDRSSPYSVVMSRQTVSGSDLDAAAIIAIR